MKPLIRLSGLKQKEDEYNLTVLSNAEASQSFALQIISHGKRILHNGAELLRRSVPSEESRSRTTAEERKVLGHSMEFKLNAVGFQLKSRMSADFERFY